MKLVVPTRKDEDWRFTPLDSVNLEEFVSETVVSKGFVSEKENQVVVVNGLFSEELSTCKFLKPLQNPVVKGEDFITRLHQEKRVQAFHLDIPAKSSEVITITYLSTSPRVAAAPFLQVTVGSSSSVTLLEEFRDEPNIAVLNCPLVHIKVEENAEVTYVRVHNLDNKNSPHLGRVTVSQGEKSKFTSFVMHAKAPNICRDEFCVDLNGEGATANLYGLYNLTGEMHSAHYVTVNHHVQKTYSHTHYNGVLDEKSHAVFRGKVVVKRDAQQVESGQMNRNLMLGEFAKVNSLPQLDIDADDVKCGHGSTIGQIDAQELFYLRSRGIPQKQAERMICEGFCLEPIGKLNEQAQLFVKGFL